MSNQSSTPESPFDQSLSEDEIRTQTNSIRNNNNISPQNSFMILDILQKSPAGQKQQFPFMKNFNPNDIRSLIDVLKETNKQYSSLGKANGQNNENVRNPIQFPACKRARNYSESNQDLSSNNSSKGDFDIKCHLKKPEGYEKKDLYKFDNVESMPSQNGLEDRSMIGVKKSRKARTAFTDAQLAELETSFEQQKYLSVQDRMELAERLNLSDMQVKTWYQNRRTKWKRQTAVGLELLNEVGNLDAVHRILQTNPYWAYHPATQNLISEIEQNKKRTTTDQRTNSNERLDEEELKRKLIEIAGEEQTLSQNNLDKNKEPEGNKTSHIIYDMIKNLVKFSNPNNISSSTINSADQQRSFTKFPRQEISDDGVRFWP